MKTLRNILFIAFALLMQSTLIGRIEIFGTRPDLALLVLIFIANQSNPVECILYGFFIGFLQDVYTPEYLGYNAFTMSLIAFLLGVLKESLTVENYSVRLFTTFIACIIHDIVYLIFYTQFDLSVIRQLLIWEYLTGAVYTSALAFVFIKTWEWVQNGGLFVVVRELLGDRR
jgi:rod shape-determining protein MreD